LFQERNTGPITYLDYDRYFYKNIRIMDSTETIRKVREEVAEIEKLVVWMEKSKEIHQVDIDVLLKKTRYLYEKIIGLQIGRFDFKDEAVAEPVAEPVAEAGAAEEPENEAENEVWALAEDEAWAEQEDEPMIEPVAETEEKTDIRAPKPEPLFQSPPQPPQPPQPQQPQPSQPRQQPQISIKPIWEPVSHKPAAPVRETISELNLFQRDGSLNDALGKQKQVPDVASSITDIPVADIWSAITINERFLFIRELFGNDPEEFKNTVTLLNSLGSWESARKFMSDRFEWDKNNPVAIDFLNVVRRRFLK
jgi:hypothetical protein